MSIQTITVNGTTWEVSRNGDDILMVDQGNPNNGLVLRDAINDLIDEALDEVGSMHYAMHYIAERLCIFAEEHFEEAVKDNWDI